MPAASATTCVCDLLRMGVANFANLFYGMRAYSHFHINNRFYGKQ